MPRCSRKGCERNGIWIPRLLLRQKSDGPVLGASLPNWPVCAECKLDCTIDAFLSDEGWNKIAKHLREVGRGRFSKNLTILEYTAHPEGEDECLPF
jgi:hypothetical protein